MNDEKILSDIVYTCMQVKFEVIKNETLEIVKHFCIGTDIDEEICDKIYNDLMDSAL